LIDRKESIEIDTSITGGFLSRPNPLVPERCEHGVIENDRSRKIGDADGHVVVHIVGPLYVLPFDPANTERATTAGGDFPLSPVPAAAGEFVEGWHAHASTSSA
jgi:hypothetical protein